MQRPTLPDSTPQTSLLRRMVSKGPIVVGVYAATSLALGFGFANPLVDAIGLASTGVGFLAGDKGIRSVTSHLDSVG